MRAHLLHGPWLPACLNCEQEIPLKRLKAKPDARRCRDCQELIDDEPVVPDSVLADHQVDDLDLARKARTHWHQRRIGGVPQEAA